MTELRDKSSQFKEIVRAAMIEGEGDPNQALALMAGALGSLLAFHQIDSTAEQEVVDRVKKAIHDTIDQVYLLYTQGNEIQHGH